MRTNQKLCKCNTPEDQPETLRRMVNRGELAQLFSGELRLCQALHRRG
jgi:hypothetical protein